MVKIYFGLLLIEGLKFHNFKLYKFPQEADLQPFRHGYNINTSYNDKLQAFVAIYLFIYLVASETPGSNRPSTPCVS